MEYAKALRKITKTARTRNLRIEKHTHTHAQGGVHCDMALKCKQLCSLHWNLHKWCRWCFCCTIANRKCGGCSLGLPHTPPNTPDSSARGSSTCSFSFSPRPSYRNRFNHRFQIQPQIVVQAHPARNLVPARAQEPASLYMHSEIQLHIHTEKALTHKVQSLLFPYAVGQLWLHRQVSSVRTWAGQHVLRQTEQQGLVGPQQRPGQPQAGEPRHAVPGTPRQFTLRAGGGSQ